MDNETQGLTEADILHRARELSEKSEAVALSQYIDKVLPYLSTAFSKAKSAKLLKQLFDELSKCSNSESIQIESLERIISWAVNEKRSFLCQAMQLRLISLLIEFKRYRDALQLTDDILKVVKKLDDKLTIVEVYLHQSRAYHAVRNVDKAQSALISARTNANAIYIPPILQASLDLQSGILHCGSRDYKTAYSYFYEALDNFSQQSDARGVLALKYMLLCQILQNSTDEFEQLLKSKLVKKYEGKDLEAMREVVKAHKARSLKMFEETLQTYSSCLQDDPIVRMQFVALCDTMLEQNLVKVIEPYSRVEIQHIADSVGLPVAQIEGKLSQMILDKVINGILDQGNGILIIYDQSQPDKLYTAAIDVLNQMTTIVDVLVEKKASLLT